MPWFHDDTEQAQAAAIAIEKPHEADWSVELVAGAASHQAAKAYEEHVDTYGHPDPEKAKEILAKISAQTVDKLVNSHGLDSVDEEEAKRLAQQHLEEALEQHGDLHPKVIVAPSQHEEFLEDLKSGEDGHHVYDTSATDAKKINQILGVEVPPITMKFPHGEESCKKCGRKYSFLDILQTGLQTHDKEFWRNVLTGKHGHVYNPHKPDASEEEPLTFNCYKCGQPNHST
jgi:hypothetical protein